MAIDIATTFSDEIMRCDYRVATSGSLDAELDLYTATVISLFTDRTAEPSDVTPDGGGHRGWWGDTFRKHKLGSRLWLLWREKQTEDVRVRAEDYAREALRWMLTEGVASRVEIVATWLRMGWLELVITIVSPAGRQSGWAWTVAWGEVSGARILRSGVVTP